MQGRGGEHGEHVQGVMNLLDNLEEDRETPVIGQLYIDQYMFNGLFHGQNIICSNYIEVGEV